MTKDDVIRMAREAGVSVRYSKLGAECWIEDLERFATLVAAAEREACLVMVKDILAGYRAGIIWQDGFDHNLQHPIQAITAAFKERGEK